MGQVIFAKKIINRKKLWTNALGNDIAVAERTEQGPTKLDQLLYVTVVVGGLLMFLFSSSIFIVI